MAYNVKYRCTHKTSTGGTASTAIIEVLQDGWGGAVTEVKGHAGRGVYRLSYEKIDINNPFESPIQKGRLEFYLVCQDPANNLSYDGQAILDEIFASDEQAYRLRLTVDGVQQWEGPVLTDQLEYPEGEYTYDGTIMAKDLTSLSGYDFPLVSSTTRLPVIEVIADILGNLNLSLPIYTYTSWATTTGATIDFLRGVHIDTYALRQYAASGNETDQPITAEQALENILRNFCLILRQSGGAWRVYQFSEVADDPTAVLQGQYDANGSLVSETSVDLTVSIDQSSRFILAGGVNTGITPVKRARITYDHRTTVSYLKLPSLIEVTGLGNDSYSDFFQSDGNQSIRLSGNITAEFPSAITESVDGLIRMEVGGYYWNGSSWVGSAADVSLPLSAPDGKTFSGPYDINTATLPANADGSVTITFNGALASGGSVPDTTKYKGNDFVIQNPTVEEGGSTAIIYQLTQGGGYSKNYDHGDTWYGVGPTSYSRAALRFSNDQLIGETFLRRGEDTATYEGTLHRLALREIIDILRSPSRVLSGPLKGDYKPHQVGVYNSASLFFIGGDLTGYENVWDAKLWEMKFAISSGDTPQTIYKDKDTSKGGTEGTSTTGAGLSQSDADARYVEKAGDTMTGDLDMGSNNITAIGNLDIEGYLDLDQIATPPDPAGNISRIYNVAEGGFSTLHYVNSSGVDFELNRDTVHIVRNISGATITQGTPVYISGSNGNFPTVAPADASDSGKLPVFGFAVQDIGDNSFGEVLEQGDLSGIDLSSYAEGQKLYLASGGGLTGTRPTGDTPVVVVGVVIKNTVSGILEVESEGVIGFIEPTLNAEFNNLEVNGTINYVNETNLQVEDKTITINKGGTDGSSIGGGIILERPGGNKSILWNGTGWALNGTLFFTDGEIQDVGTGADAEFNSLDINGSSFVDSSRNVSANSLTVNSQSLFTLGNEQLLSTDASPTFVDPSVDSITIGTPNESLGSHGIRSDKDIILEDYAPFIATSADRRRKLSLYVADNSDPTKARLDVENTVGTGAGVDGRLIIGIAQPDNTIIDVAQFDNDRVTLNTITEITGTGVTSGLELNNSWKIYENSDSLLFTREGTGDAEVVIGRRDTANALTVNGTADITTAQIQTLRTTLFKPTTISGMGGEIAFSAVSSVVSVDTGANTIVVEDAVFANGDSVVVSSAIYNQSGFSNVELNITSAGSAVSGGTQYSYAVNSGSELDIGKGDSVTRVNGDLVYINATKGAGSPRIAGFDGLTGFADSPLSGDTATAIWELNPTGGVIGGLTMDGSKLYTGDGTNGYVGLGATNGATDRAFWAGAANADGSGSAAFYVQQDGRIFHDAVGSGVYARTELASFTTNSNASSITDQEYSTTVSSTTNGTFTDRDTKVRTVALKRFGADTLIVSGYGRSDGDANSGTTITTPRARVYIKATDLETSATNEASASLSSGSGQFSISLDISSLTDGNNMLLEVDAEAEIEISGADGATYTGECYLREDVFIQTATS